MRSYFTEDNDRADELIRTMPPMSRQARELFLELPTKIEGSRIFDMLFHDAEEVEIPGQPNGVRLTLTSVSAMIFCDEIAKLLKQVLALKQAAAATGIDVREFFKIS